MTREEIINQIKCILSELDNGVDAVSYLTQNDVEWLNEIIKALELEPITKNNLTDYLSRAEMVKYQEYLDGKISNDCVRFR